MSEKWVQVWGQAHSALSHFYYPSCAKTYRTVISSAISGKQLRLELSNCPAKNTVEIGGVTVAKCDKKGTFIDGNFTVVTVHSKTSFTLGVNETVTTDPIDFTINAGELFCVNIFVIKGSLRSGNLIDNVNLITVKGDYTKTPYAENQPRVRDSVRKVASSVLRMCFHKPIPLLNTVELLNDDGASSIVVFGDSISQQGFWTNAFEKRIREKFFGRYTVINRSIMGNRVLRDFSTRFPCPGLFGISGIKRYNRDVLRFPDAEYVVFVLGINDFIQYGTLMAPKCEKPTPEKVFNAVKDMAQQAHDRDKKFVLLNILHFGYCIDSNAEKEEMAKEYNRLIEENKDFFDAVYDQASLCADENKPNCTKLEFLGKDKLHPNFEGGQIVANNFDLTIFE